jgi:putative ABC transport system permease protein
MEPVPRFRKKDQLRTLKQQQHKPPRLAQRILLGFLRDDLAEEVTGDLDEKFYSMLEKTSVRKARLNYWFQTLQYIRPFALRKSNSVTLNHFDMFRNYFKIAWRNMTRQKMYSAIKIGGFALGIAACFLIALFIKDELSYDKYYPDANRIYRVVQEFDDNGETGLGVDYPAPFARTIQAEFPEIEKAGRFMPHPLFAGAGDNQIRRTDQTENTFEQGFTFADSSIPEIFGIKMLYGNRSTALNDPYTMVISKKKADKYFPNENPVGKTMILNNNKDRIYRIGGVMEDFPSNSHLKYDFLLTLRGVELGPGEQTFWRAQNYPTYVRLHPGADPEQLANKLSIITKKYIIPSFVEAGIKDDLKAFENIKFHLQPVSDIHLRSQGIDDEMSHGDIRFIWLFGAVAIFILFIACINFINLSTARSANRAKEVGLRKVVGSFRSNLVRQFLTESVLFSFLSFIIGILLAWAFLPWFNELSGKSLQFPWTAWWLLPVFAGAILLVGLLAGLYPALYLSAFKPIQVLKGNISRGSKSSVTRNTLVVFQFAISIILIAGTFIIYRQMSYIMNKKTGFDKDQVLMIEGTNTMNKQSLYTLKNELTRLRGVRNVTVSDYLPIKGTKRNNNGFWLTGKINVDKPVYRQIWRVDHDYIKTMGMKIVEGRDFNLQIPSDSQAVIINQSMVKDMGLKNPIGARITNGFDRTIIGVIEDFHAESMKENILGLCLVIGGQGAGIVSLKVNTADMQEMIRSVTQVWKRFAPDQPIRYTFLDEQYANMYADVQRTGRIFTSFAVLAVIIACLGLFALSAFMVQQRNKEISIRLVLGASTRSIFRLLTQNFLVLIFIALVIAIPISWYVMQKWLQDFVYRIEIGWEIFFWTALIATGIALLTISHQALRAALTDPVKNLRSE